MVLCKTIINLVYVHLLTNQSGNESKMKNQDFIVEKLFEEYRDKVFGFFVDFLSDRNLAQDLTQDIFLKLLGITNHLHKIQDMDGYIYQMCRNLAFDHLRMAAHNTEYRKIILLDTSSIQQTEAPIKTNPTEQKIDSDHYQYLLNTCLNNLPEQQRQVFTLSKIEGLSNKRIAEQLKISPHTVRNHLYQAHKNIRSLISHSDLLIFVTLISMSGIPIGLGTLLIYA